MSRVMAIDVGASSYRIIEGHYNKEEFRIKVLKRFKHTPIIEDGHYRWNITEMVDNLIEVLRREAVEGEPVDAIGFDSFGTDFGLLDHNRVLIEKPVAYRDSISEGISERYFRDARKLYAMSGGTFNTTCTAHILKGLQTAEYKTFAKAENLLFIPDLLAFFFTGIISNEFTIASTSRLVDMEKRQWNKEMLEKLGFKEKLFRPLDEAGKKIGKLKEEISLGIKNLQNTEVIMTAGHDTASAVLTIPEMDHCSFISSGTWSVKGIVSKKPYLTDRACDFQMSNEGQPWGKYRLIRNITGMWLLEECLRNWKQAGEEMDIIQLIEQVENVQSFPSLIYPDSSQFSRPGEMPDKIKKYCSQSGQPVPESPAQIAQVILHSLACEYRRHNEELEAVTGEKIECIFIVGGGRNNQYLNQYTANITGCDVYAGHPEATAAGNILVQLLALGEIQSFYEIPAIVSQNMKVDIFKPDIKADCQNTYQSYLKLVNKECR